MHNVKPLDRYLNVLSRAQSSLAQMMHNYPRVGEAVAFAAFVIIARAVVGVALYKVVNEEEEK